MRPNSASASNWPAPMARYRRAGFDCGGVGWPALLRGPHRIEELADLELEAIAVTGQRLRRREHLRRSRSGLARPALHVGDVGGNLLGAVSRLLHVAGNFLGRRTLLFHRGGNGR